MKLRNKHKNKSTSGLVMGYGWYSEEEWNKLKKVSIDSSELDDTYEAFLENIDNFVAMAKATKGEPRMIDIQVKELSEWCLSQGIPIDSQSRADFILRKTKEHEEKSNVIQFEPKIELSSLMKKFMRTLELYPKLETYWQVVDGSYEVQLDRIREEGGVLSHSEQIMLKFLAMVFMGENELGFDMLEAAKVLDEDKRQVVIEWFENPYWP